MTIVELIEQLEHVKTKHNLNAETEVKLSPGVASGLFDIERVVYDPDPDAGIVLE